MAEFVKIIDKTSINVEETWEDDANRHLLLKNGVHIKSYSWDPLSLRRSNFDENIQTQNVNRSDDSDDPTFDSYPILKFPFNCIECKTYVVGSVNDTSKPLCHFGILFESVDGNQLFQVKDQTGRCFGIEANGQDVWLRIGTKDEVTRLMQIGMANPLLLYSGQYKLKLSSLESIINTSLKRKWKKDPKLFQGTNCWFVSLAILNELHAPASANLISIFNNQFAPSFIGSKFYWIYCIGVVWFEFNAELIIILNDMLRLHNIRSRVHEYGPLLCMVKDWCMF